MKLSMHPHPPPPSEGIPNQLNVIAMKTNEIIATAIITRMMVNFL